MIIKGLMKLSEQLATQTSIANDILYPVLKELL